MEPYDRHESQPIAAGLKPFHEELTERYERADSRSIGRWSKRKLAERRIAGIGYDGISDKRKAGHKPDTGHPWRNPKPGESPASCADRFSQAPSPVKHLVRDGRPLTERGQELLRRPLQVVVSPAGKPLHSRQTKQVHQYQQTQGRR